MLTRPFKSPFVYDLSGGKVSYRKRCTETQLRHPYLYAMGMRPVPTFQEELLSWSGLVLSVLAIPAGIAAYESLLMLAITGPMLGALWANDVHQQQGLALLWHHLWLSPIALGVSGLLGPVIWWLWRWAYNDNNFL